MDNTSQRIARWSDGASETAAAERRLVLPLFGSDRTWEGHLQRAYLDELAESLDIPRVSRSGPAAPERGFAVFGTAARPRPGDVLQFTPASLWSMAVTTATSRFSGARVVLDLRPPSADSLIDTAPVIAAALLRLCSRVLVNGDEVAARMQRLGISARTMPVGLPTGVVRTRLVEAVQPRILAYLPGRRSGSDWGGLDCLMRAFDLVKRKYPRTEMTLAVDPSEGSRELPITDSFGITRLLVSELSEAKELIAAHDLLVSPRALDVPVAATIHAMASGLPTVAVRSTALSPYLRDEVNCLTVAPNRPQEMAERVVRLVEDNELVTSLSQQAAKTAAVALGTGTRQRWTDFYRQVRAS